MWNILNLEFHVPSVATSFIDFPTEIYDVIGKTQRKNYSKTSCILCPNILTDKHTSCAAQAWQTWQGTAETPTHV